MADIRLSTQGDLPALRALFGRVFEESEEGLELFFSRCYHQENTLVAEEDGRLCGMFYILPARLLCQGGTLDVAYLYALAVDESRRGKGIAGEILQALDRLLPARGYAAALLKPAEPPLYPFYRRYGFDHSFFVKRYRFASGQEGKVTPLSLDRQPLAREEAFSCRPLFLWDNAMLRYAEDFNRLNGGRTYYIETAQGSGYAHTRIKNGALFVSELGGAPAPALLGALAAKLGLPGGEALLPISAPCGEEEPSALLKWYIPARETKNGYFSLALD